MRDLPDERSVLFKQLEELKSVSSEDNNSEIKELEEFQCRLAQIEDLQQKILDADVAENNESDRWNIFQTISYTEEAIKTSSKLMSDVMEEMIRTTKWDSKVQSLENDIASIEEKCDEVNKALNEKESEFSRQRQEYEKKIVLLLKFYNLDVECEENVFLFVIIVKSS